MSLVNNCNKSSLIPRSHIPSCAIMKPVGDACNLRCNYCYYRTNHKSSQPCVSKRMDLEVADQAMRQFLECGDALIRYDWHGGEPLMAGKDFFKEVVELQTAYPKRRFYNAIQTNATLVDKEWADFFAKHHFGVGVSLDGPAEVHNIHRKDSNGQGTFDKTLAGIQMLQEAGCRISTISVITKDSLPHVRSILQFFLDIKIFSFKFNPLFDEDLEFAVSPKEYADFLCEIFDHYAAYKDPRVRIEPLENMIQPFIGKRVGGCSLAGNCAKQIVIKNDGSIKPCDRFVDDAIVFGNVLEGGLSSAMQVEKRHEFIDVITERLHSCSACKWFKFCHGGCTIGYIGKQGKRGNYCQANKLIFQYIEDNFVFQVAPNISLNM